MAVDSQHYVLGIIWPVETVSVGWFCYRVCIARSIARAFLLALFADVCIEVDVCDVLMVELFWVSSLCA